MKRLLPLLMLLFVLTGCGAATASSSSAEVSSSGEGDASAVIDVQPECGFYCADSGRRLRLWQDGTFYMVCEPDRLYVPAGTYTVEDGVLTAVDTVFDKTYRFRVEDEHTLTFLAQESSDFTVVLDGIKTTTTAPTDGQSFVWTDEDAWWEAREGPLTGFYRADEERLWFIYLTAEDHTFYMYNNDPTGRTVSGSYTLEGDRLIATTEDGRRYTYQIWGKQMLAFLGGESDVLELFTWPEPIEASNQCFYWMSDMGARLLQEEAAPPKEPSVDMGYYELYESCRYYATADQLQALDAIPEVESCGSKGVGVYVRAVMTIMDLLPEDQPRLTLADAEQICAYASALAEERDEFTVHHTLLEEFNAVAGAPDYHGGSGNVRWVWLLNEEGTEYITLSSLRTVRYFNENTGENLRLYPQDEE